MRTSRGLSASLLCVAGATWTGDASATCVERKLMQLVDEGCELWPAQTWPADLPLRVSLLSTTFCQAPGGPGNTTERSPSPAELAELELWREGCSAPEEATFARVPQTCGLAAVAVADRTIGPGKYQIRWSGQAFGVVVEGGEAVPCPSEEAYRERLRQEQLERLRRDREERERLRPRDLERLERERAACRPPRQWNAVGRYCQSPQPGPEAAPPPADPKHSFWDDPDWEDDRGEWGFTVSVGATGRWLRRRARDENEDDVDRGLVGGTVAAGFRHFGDYDGESVLQGVAGGNATVDGLVWCAPIGCMVIGLFLMPTEGFVGNEHGLEVRGLFARDYREGDDAFTAGVSLRPILRVSRDSRFATGTFFGTILPEVGLQFPGDDRTEMFFSWAIYPVDLRIGRYLALSWDGPCWGPVIPLDGGRVWMNVSTGLSLNVLSISD